MWAGYFRPFGRWLAIMAVWGGVFAGLEDSPRAQAPGAGLELVAVLELDNRSKRLTLDDIQYVTDAVRKAAAEGLDRRVYHAMTRENMDLIVPPQERVCMSGMCYAEIGRKLQARFVVGGNVRDIGGLFGVTLEAYEARTGVLLASEQGEAKDVLGWCPGCGRWRRG